VEIGVTTGVMVGIIKRCSGWYKWSI